MSIAMTTPKEELARFDWRDPLQLDDQLNEDERMVRETAARYAADKLMPRQSNRAAGGDRDQHIGKQSSK